MTNEMKGIRIILIVTAVWICGVVHAQTFSMGGVMGAECELKILNGWHVSAEGELRFDHDFTRYDRAKLGIGTDYTFWRKRLKVGVAYDYLNYYDREDRYFESRHRLKGFVSVAPKFGDWKVAYRAMVQSTFRDERRGSYKYNPKTYMRNRLQVTWSVPYRPLKLYLSEEFWWRLYKPGDNIIDQLRTIVGVKYDINKRHSLDFFVRSDNEIQVKNPENVLFFGIVYSFSGPRELVRRSPSFIGTPAF